MDRIALGGQIFVLGLLLGLGCQNSGDARYEEGEELSKQWCTRAQIHLAALEGTEWDETKITVQHPATSPDLTFSKAHIDAENPTPISIVSFVEPMTNSVDGDAPDSVSKNVICKMKSQEGIESGLSVEISGDEGSCFELNQMAIDWAAEQLGASEKTKYDTEGKKLAVADDLMGISGSTWYGTQSQFTVTGDTYSLASSALIVPYEANPGFPEDLRGVHYCKLLAPSQALFWMLNRAFWQDPLGPGPNNDEDASLVDERGCEPTQMPTPGSCIFSFAVSGQHYCEEYTGSIWTETSAGEHCADRVLGVFMTSSCSERENETSQIDNDGEYKGVCMINCGNDEEYRWHVYSDPEGDMPIDDYCQDWFPLE